MLAIPRNAKLRLTVVSSQDTQSFTANGIMNDEKGVQHPFQIQILTGDALVSVQKEVQMPMGVLLWASCSQATEYSGNANKYVKLELLDFSMVGGEQGSAICEGYVDQNESVSYPAPLTLSTQAGAESTTAHEYGQSSAGAAAITFITLQYLSRIDLIRFKYVADTAEASTRVITMTLQSPSGMVIGLGVVSALTNSTNEYQLTRDFVPATLPANFTGLQIPSLVMEKSYTFRLAVTNSNALDVASDLMIAGTGRLWFSGI